MIIWSCAGLWVPHLLVLSVAAASRRGDRVAAGTMPATINTSDGLMAIRPRIGEDGALVDARPN